MEAIKLETCTHENLLELDQTQGYTAIANNTMMNVITNPIIAPAARLWILIRYQQSGFYDREYIERRVSWFAEKLSVSVSTIQKWQRLLEREGYLEIVEQKYSSKNNKPNRYRACLPKSVIKQIKDKPRVYTKFTNKGVETPEGKRSTKGEGSKDDLSNVEPINKSPLKKEVEDTTPIDSKSLEPVFSQSPRWLIDMLPGLKVEIEERKLWITGVHQHARNLIREKQEQLIEHLGGEGYSVTEVRFNKDQKALIKKPVTSEKPRQSERTTKQPAHIPKQKIFNHTRHSVYKRLLKTSINGHTLPPNQAKELCEQVIYSVEKGALKHQPKLMGINIALKLIRENRWSTPAGFSVMGSSD